MHTIPCVASLSVYQLVYSNVCSKSLLRMTSDEWLRNLLTNRVWLKAVRALELVAHALDCSMFDYSLRLIRGNFGQVNPAHFCYDWQYDTSNFAPTD